MKTETKSAAEKTAVKSTAKPVAKPAPSKSNSLKGMFEKAAASRKTIKKEEIKKEETPPGKENRMNEEKEQKSKASFSTRRDLKFEIKHAKNIDFIFRALVLLIMKFWCCL